MDKNVFTLGKAAPSLWSLLQGNVNVFLSDRFNMFADVLVNPIGKVILITYDQDKTWQKIFGLISSVFNHKDRCRKYAWVFHKESEIDSFYKGATQKDSSFLFINTEWSDENKLDLLVLKKYKQQAVCQGHCIFLKQKKEHGSMFEINSPADLCIVGSCQKEDEKSSVRIRSSYMSYKELLL